MVRSYHYYLHVVSYDDDFAKDESFQEINWHTYVSMCKILSADNSRFYSESNKCGDTRNFWYRNLDHNSLVPDFIALYKICGTMTIEDVSSF